MRLAHRRGKVESVSPRLICAEAGRKPPSSLFNCPQFLKTCGYGKTCFSFVLTSERKRGTHRQPVVNPIVTIAARRRQSVGIVSVFSIAGAQPGWYKTFVLNCKRFYRVKRGTHRQPAINITTIVAARRRQTVDIVRIIVVAGAQPGNTKLSPLNYKRL